jgi:prevent-host-death family protein
MSVVSLYEAKTHLSALVDQAAAGEEIIISKNGVPQARLGPIPQAGQARRVPVNTMGITDIPDDFDAPDEELIALFYESKLFPDE